MKKHSFNQNRIQLKLDIDSSQNKALAFQNPQKRDTSTRYQANLNNSHQDKQHFANNTSKNDTWISLQQQIEQKSTKSKSKEKIEFFLNNFINLSAFESKCPQMQEGLYKITQQFVELTNKLQILNENASKDNNINQSKKAPTSSTRSSKNSTYLFNNYLNQIEKSIKSSTATSTYQNDNLLQKSQLHSPKKISDYEIQFFEKENILQHQLRQQTHLTQLSIKNINNIFRDAPTGFSQNFNFYQLDNKGPTAQEKTVNDLIKQNITKNSELKLMPTTTKNQDKFNFEFRSSNQYFSPQNKEIKQHKLNYDNNNNSLYQKGTPSIQITNKIVDNIQNQKKQGSAKKAESQNPPEKKSAFQKSKVKRLKQQQVKQGAQCKLDELQTHIEQMKTKMLIQKNVNNDVQISKNIITESSTKQVIHTTRPENYQKALIQKKEVEKQQNLTKTSQIIMTNQVKTLEFFSELQTLQNRTITQFRNCYLVKKLVKGCAFDQNKLMQQWLLESISQTKAIQDGTIISKKLKQSSKLQQIKPKCEQSHSKPILIFDLDETLVHCIDYSNLQDVKRTDDIKLFSIQANNKTIKVGIKLRPFAQESLEELSKYYEISIFTASHQSYADQVIDYLDNKKIIKNRWYREHCNEAQTGIFVKDLSKLGLNESSEILIVDNAIISFACQLDNGIPILPFYDDDNDQELKDLTQYLKRLSQWKNIIQVNKKVFQLQSYSNFNTPSELVENLYPEQFSSK